MSYRASYFSNGFAWTIMSNDQATASHPEEGYGVRRCRGHWHVVDFASGEEIATPGDPFSDVSDALDAADALNAERRVFLHRAGTQGERP